MELMALGSPTAASGAHAASVHPHPLLSPGSPAAGMMMASQVGSVPAASGAPFLPSFLLGDHSHHSSPALGAAQSTAGIGQLQHQSSAGSPQKQQRQQQQQQQLNRSQLGRDPMLTSTPTFGANAATPRGPLRPAAQIANGKPTPTGPSSQTLFSRSGAVHTPRAADGRSPFLTPSKPNSLAQNNAIREELLNNSNVTPGAYDYGLWVTVFGFPPSAAGFVLSQFSQCGTIVKHYTPPNGNWMHIKYRTKMQAQKALGRCNRILGGSIMIGVTPCTDQAMMTDDFEEPSFFNQSASAAAPPVTAVPIAAGQADQNQTGPPATTVAMTATAVDTSVNALNSSMGASKLNNSIRPLTQAYKAASSDHNISFHTNTPNKNSGIMSKAMEYMFGW